MGRIALKPVKTIAGLTSALMIGACLSSSAAQESSWGNTGQPAEGVTITTIGTGGGPPPRLGRAQPATLIEVDGHGYLIDAGDGTGYLLQQAGTRPNRLTALFISHLHWDHVLGVEYILATDWMVGRTSTLPIYGPPGLDYFLSRVLSTIGVGEDIFRSQADYRPALETLYPSTEVQSCDQAEIYSDAQVTVQAVCNSHFDHVRSEDHTYGPDRSLSFRFDTEYGSVTVTGDTGPSEAVEKLAKDSDVLVAEIVDLPSIQRALEAINPGADHSVLMSHMATQHLTAEEVGKLATHADVKRVILTHLIFGPGFDPVEFASQVGTEFDGEVIVADDLQSFDLSTPAADQPAP